MSAARHNESGAEELLGAEAIAGAEYAHNREGGHEAGAPEGGSAPSPRILPSGAILSPTLSSRTPVASQGNGANAPAVSRALARGLVLARATRNAQDASIHGQLVGLGGSRIEQIANLEYRLSTIAARRGSPLDRAQEVLVLLRQLMARETGTPHLDDALPLFFRRLGAESHIQNLVTGLVRDATSVMTSSRVSERFNTPGGVVESLDFLLGWYVRRTGSMQALDDLSVGDDHEECLFNIRVTHDASWAGEPGVEVSCGLRLLGRAQQPLWLKLFVRSEGRPVAPREGYHQWVDDTEPLLVSNEDAAARVAAVMQITPLRQRQIVDRVSLFLPYASLLLPAGSREVELELGLFDEHGFPVFEASQLETLSIPRRSQQELALTQPGVLPSVRVPSPQSLGLWSESPVSGTRIQNVSARVVARESTALVASRASSASVEAVEVSFDLFLCGHSSQALYVESRVLERNGSAVSSRVSRSNTEEPSLSRTAFSVRQEVHPESSFQILREATLQFPTQALDLETGVHDLFVEVSLLGADDRVLVGTLVPLVLNVSDQTGTREESAKLRTSLSLSEQLIGLQQRVCTAEPGHDLGAQRKRTIRVEASVRDERSARALLRVRSSIETAEGRHLLADTVLVPADPVTREFRYVGHFDEHTLLSILARAESERGSRGEKLSTAVIGPQKLIARIEWCSSDDQSLMSQTIPVTLSGHLSSTGEAQTAEVVVDEARVVDVSCSAAPLVGESGVGIPSAVIAWVVPAHEVGGNLPCLFAELLDAAGEPVSASDSSGSDQSSGGSNLPGSLRGVILRADPSLRELHIRRGGLVLCSLPLMVRSEDWKNAHSLKLMSFSASGRVTQVVTVPLGKANSQRPKVSRSSAVDSNSGTSKSTGRSTNSQSWLQRVLG
jgi:hypothetical protein